jgi:hypothetical protein
MKIEGFEVLPLKNNREMMIDGIPAPGPSFLFFLTKRPSLG